MRGCRPVPELSGNLWARRGNDTSLVNTSVKLVLIFSELFTGLCITRSYYHSISIVVSELLLYVFCRLIKWQWMWQLWNNILQSLRVTLELWTGSKHQLVLAHSMITLHSFLSSLIYKLGVQNVVSDLQTWCTKCFVWLCRTTQVWSISFSAGVY